ncbi:MAG: 16S rRNA (adenine(1518)-N(6)/adenine(1519)-N(6))-dimethyltransferase RsmA [Defluviitaleaceae bacterium]|nr:16S rRNA (adenine(1518)-N(6)/adenine(1519)-N(6))-dimethyltransferase RsmA [Defluviitaleaceae bacterium]
MLNNLKEQIEKYNFSIKKGYGQNFLIDKGMINKIVDGAKLPEKSIVLEIGPGFGSLTNALSSICEKVICIEIDKSLIPILESYNLLNVQVIHSDFLKLDLEELLKGYSELHVVANLPYYISTPIIMKLLTYKPTNNGAHIKSMTMMMQKEVAARLKAEKNSKEYGSLTLAVGYYAAVSHVANVPSGCFHPRPAVESTVIRLEKKENGFQTDERKLFSLIKMAFAKRRKTLVNSLLLSGFEGTKEQISSTLSALGIKENTRAEDLDLEDYVRLNNHLHW